MRAITLCLCLFLSITVLGCEGTGGTSTSTSGAGGAGGGDPSAASTTSSSTGVGGSLMEPIPCETQIDCVGQYPFQACVDGQCQMKPWAPNCIGATGNGSPDTGCDDENPCTTDVIVDGQCQHQIAGAGATCGENMQCWSAECCPVETFCNAEGVQDKCADGSVCFSGKCWISCKENPSSCAGTQFPTCGTKTVGSVSVEVCL